MKQRISAIAAMAFIFMSYAEADMELLLELVQTKDLSEQASDAQINSDQRFNYLEFATRDVDLYLINPGENSGLPESLQGLWWMDGNPLPDEVVSFGGSTWNSWLNTITIDVFGSGVWTWHSSNSGITLFKSALNTRLIYFFQFNQAISFARITPIVNINGVVFPIPRFIAEFSMSFVEDGHWVRETKFFGRDSDPYQLRRIVKANGEKEVVFDEFLQKSPESLFIPVD